MFEKVREMIAKQLKIDQAKISLESRIVEDLGADSIQIVELLFALEDSYGIVIDDDDAVKIKTVGDMVGFLEKQKIKK